MAAAAVQVCAWCDAPAEFFLLSDRDSHNAVDHACAEHARAHGHLYRRAVLMPSAPVVDLREQSEVDVRGAAVPAARDASASEQADRTGSAY
ncbi:MAG: hypothetical protein LCI03_03190 [Actinobacteria bacterium]|nr:hypothetical protein [Actinomycetota bacterium]